jgi:hypothetical protein
LEKLGTRENMRNPKQSEGRLAQYETKSVDIVHTPFRGALEDYRGTRCPEIWAAESSKSIAYLDIEDALQVVDRYGFHIRDVGLLAISTKRSIRS